MYTRPAAAAIATVRHRSTAYLINAPYSVVAMQLTVEWSNPADHAIPTNSRLDRPGSWDRQWPPAPIPMQWWGLALPCLPGSGAPYCMNEKRLVAIRFPFGLWDPGRLMKISGWCLKSSDLTP